MDHVSPRAALLRALSPKFSEYNFLGKANCTGDQQCKEQEHLCHLEGWGVGRFGCLCPDWAGAGYGQPDKGLAGLEILAGAH